MWIADTTIAAMDTLLMRVSYSAYDTLHRLVWSTDTINLRYREAKPDVSGRRSRRQKEEVPQKEYLNLQLNITQNGSMDLNRQITITSPRPVSDFDSTRMHFFKMIDTIEVAEPFHLLPDSARIRKFAFGTDWEEGAKYHLYIDPGAFTDIYGLGNDTIDIRFTTRRLDYYGKLIFNMTGNEAPFVIHLMNDKNNIIASRSVSDDTKIEFSYLPPGNYRLKAIRDMNRNGLWDTGNYLENVQPEKVYFYPDPIELRSNWDVDITWEIP
jgi:hypothetical protein